MDVAILAGAMLIMFSLGIFAGHAAGYARRGHVEHNRRMAAISGQPRYSRSDVGPSD